MLLLVSSVILIALGLLSVLMRDALWERIVRRRTALGRAVGDELAWKRNILIGGTALIGVGALGIIAVLIA